MEYGIIQKKKKKKKKSNITKLGNLWTFNLPSTPRMIVYTYMTVYDIVYVYIYTPTEYMVRESPISDHPGTCRDVRQWAALPHVRTWAPSKSGSWPWQVWRLTNDWHIKKMWELTMIYPSKMVLKNHGKVWILLHETLGIYLDLAMVLWLISCGKIGIESCEMTSEYWKWLWLRTWSSKNCFASQNTGFSRNKIANLESIWEENTYRWLIGVTISIATYHV